MYISVSLTGIRRLLLEQCKSINNCHRLPSCNILLLTRVWRLLSSGVIVSCAPLLHIQNKYIKTLLTFACNIYHTFLTLCRRPSQAPQSQSSVTSPTSCRWRPSLTRGLYWTLLSIHLISSFLYERLSPFDRLSHFFDRHYQ